MSDSDEWAVGIEGNFPLHKAVIEVMPKGTKAISQSLVVSLLGQRLRKSQSFCQMEVQRDISSR